MDFYYRLKNLTKDIFKFSDGKLLKNYCDYDTIKLEDILTFFDTNKTLFDDDIGKIFKFAVNKEYFKFFNSNYIVNIESSRNICYLFIGGKNNKFINFTFNIKSNEAYVVYYG
jgi:hypothetical protein